MMAVVGGREGGESAGYLLLQTVLLLVGIHTTLPLVAAVAQDAAHRRRRCGLQVGDAAVGGAGAGGGAR